VLNYSTLEFGLSLGLSSHVSALAGSLLFLLVVNSILAALALPCLCFHSSACLHFLCLMSSQGMCN
jgi:hypothetical protein